MTELSRADKHKVVNGVISSCGTAALSEVESRALRRGSRKSQGGNLTLVPILSAFCILSTASVTSLNTFYASSGKSSPVSNRPNNYRGRNSYLYSGQVYLSEHAKVMCTDMYTSVEKYLNFSS